MPSIPSVKDYGALGNGTADDTSAINAAYAANEFVYFPEGTYLYDGVFVGKGIGPGKIVRKNTVKPMGKQLIAGAAAAATDFLNGGLLIGGEGPGTTGVLLFAGHSNAVTYAPTRIGQPFELDLFPSIYMGRGTTVPGTDRINFPAGEHWDSGDVEVDDLIAFGHRLYAIRSIATTAGRISAISVKEISGATVTFAGTVTNILRHSYVYSEGTCNTSGTTALRTSGDEFYLEGKIRIGSTIYSVSTYVNGDQLILESSAGIQTGVPFKQKWFQVYPNIFRVQGIWGGNEENISIIHEITGAFTLETQFAGHGRQQPIIFATGNDYDHPVTGSRRHMAISEDGRVIIGRVLDIDERYYPVDAKLYTYRSLDANQGGTTTYPVIRAAADFNGTDGRWLDIGIINNWHGGYLQSYYGDGTNAPTFINPRGGQVIINSTGIASGIGTECVLGVNGNIVPLGMSGTKNLGQSLSQKWNNVYAKSFVTSSDIREKTDIKACDLGLDFVNRLRPVSYRWAEQGYTETVEISVEKEVNDVIMEEAESEAVTVENGQAVRRRVRVPTAVQLYDELPLYDEDGKPVLDAAGRPTTYRVPRKKIVTETTLQSRDATKPGTRMHYGLVAQDVERTLRDIGIADFCGLVVAQEGGEDKQGLRYDEFIAPLIAAVQELTERVKRLELERARTNHELEETDGTDRRR